MDKIVYGVPIDRGDIGGRTMAKPSPVAFEPRDIGGRVVPGLKATDAQTLVDVEGKPLIGVILKGRIFG
jgi:hypothetical protein